MELTNNSRILEWIDEVSSMTRPEKIVWIDGSEEQLDELRRQAVDEGILIKLNDEKLPGCYLHRTDVNDVARVEDRTLICCKKEEDAGPTNHWMAPDKMREKLFGKGGICDGAMTGRTMYVIPYSMSVVGSPFAKYGIELSDSIYVVLNMAIMTRVGKMVLDAIGEKGDFIRGIHCQCDLNKDDKYIVQFPETDEIVSVNSNYGGNVLQGKKCFALRIASNLGRREGWMAEHMLILGMESPEGETHYVCAAFPSACGKTNLAMLIPPEIYRKKGWKVWTVGDDIAWLRVGSDGRLWAVNPENGFFGVAPGTNEHSNFNALASTKKGTIFTNVALDPRDNTVWWEGMTKTPPEHLIDWQGRPWTPDAGYPAAYPNSRFTAPAKNCPCVSPEFDNPQGVPIDAIIFGGRRAKTAPLVYQSRDWDHGVFVGSVMASEKTAAAAGKVGELRRDPMAMIPFCGYNMADYWQHWLDMGKLIPNPPKIFNVNWFRTDENGRFVWPGFGDNMRVLMWILARCRGEAEAVETPIGYEPRPEDIDVTGLEGVDAETVRSLLYVDDELWHEDCENVKEFYAKFNGRVPQKLLEELEKLESSLKQLSNSPA